jgi:carbon monoxide dehydrogenase subunit G
MDITGEYRIPARREEVWAALNDPATLAACIPGCESLEQISDDRLSARIKAKIGPVSATFSCFVSFSNVRPPEGYTISGEGKGGAAGFAKGSADVSLEEDGDQTVLRYTAKGEAGGKLAQVGSRLIESATKKLADDFFNAFAVKLGGGEYVNVLAGVPPQHTLRGEPVVEDRPEEAAEFAENIEERLEVAAGRGVLGGPVVWGLLALLAVIVLIYYLTS